MSSKEQEETGYSLPAQEKFLKEYASRNENNFEISKVFQISESASGKIDRKTFKEMLNYVRKCKVPVIIVETTDRLTRNFADVPAIDQWLMENENHQIHLAKEGCVLHKNSKSHEWFMWRVKVATAEYYVRLLSENVQKGQKEKISQGWLPTKPPLGYKSVGEKGHKIHVVDEKVAPLIKQMFTLYATGSYSIKALTEKMYVLGLRSRGGSKVVKSAVHRLLSDPFYYGKFLWKDVLYQGKHEPLISKDLFDGVREKLNGGRPRPYYGKHLKELQGKVLCGACKKTVTWERQKGQWYGGCKQCKAQLGEKKQYIRQEDLEARLLPHAVAVAPRGAKVLAVLTKALKESHSEEIEYHDAQVQSINNSLERIQQRKRVMYDDKLDGRITVPFYDQRLKEFTEEEEGLVGALDNLKSDNTEYYKVGIAIHELALRAQDIYHSEKATVEERRLLLSYAFSSVSVLKGQVVPSYTKPFGFLADWMPKVNAILEPMQNTAETVVPSGGLPIPAPISPLELPEVRLHSRTSKKPSVNTRPSHLPTTSGALLRSLDAFRTKRLQDGRLDYSSSRPAIRAYTVQVHVFGIGGGMCA
ncbi:recombinase family protein [Candidatus Kaiserbacteria bacterium]|nr:recombinase family protein [Candidatus Kaiserbacteria bacterium]